jgi:Fur family transcriptional regulator, ferric uptake regulator
VPISSLTTVVGNERADAIVERLRLSGGRMTRPRRMVIDALARSPSHHLTAADIVAVVRAEDPEFYESTVYRTLDLLVDLGIVERVQLGPGGAVFHLPNEPHHHLVCQSCGDVLEIPATLLDELATHLHDELGVRLRPSASTLVGSCARCSGATETL